MTSFFRATNTFRMTYKTKSSKILQATKMIQDKLEHRANQKVEICIWLTLPWTMKKSRYEYAIADDIFFRS